MKFGFLLSVKDVNKARKFYEEIFNLKVAEDFGKCIIFSNNLSLQEDFHWLVGINKEDVKEKANNAELFFEEDNFDLFVEKIKSRKDIKFLHDVKEHSWGQRTIRFYDLDFHLIEVGENIEFVVKRFLNKGMSVNEVAKKMDVETSYVENIITK